MSGTLIVQANELSVLVESTNSWTATAKMQHARYAFAGALLADGNVLVSGGVNESGRVESSGEIYDTGFVVQASADLSLTKTDSPDPVDRGAQLTYTVTVTNSASSQLVAQNVVATDTLPNGVTFNSVSTAQGTCTGTATVSCNPATLSPGSSATVTSPRTSPVSPSTITTWCARVVKRSTTSTRRS